MIEKIYCPQLSEPPGATWSNVLRVGSQVHISGLHAMPWAKQAIEQGKPLSAYAQSVIIFEKLKNLLASADTSLDKVYKLVIYTKSMKDKDGVNQARAEFFQDPFPCSTLVVVQGFAFDEIDVEIDVFTEA